MCFLQSTNVFCCVMSLYMIKNIYLKPERPLYLRCPYLAERIAVENHRLLLNAGRRVEKNDAGMHTKCKTEIKRDTERLPK